MDWLQPEVYLRGMEAGSAYLMVAVSRFLGFRLPTSSDSESLEEFVFLMPDFQIALAIPYGLSNSKRKNSSSLELLSGNREWQRKNRGPPSTQHGSRSQNPSLAWPDYSGVCVWLCVGDCMCVDCNCRIEKPRIANRNEEHSCNVPSPAWSKNDDASFCNINLTIMKYFGNAPKQMRRNASCNPLQNSNPPFPIHALSLRENMKISGAPEFPLTIEAPQVWQTALGVYQARFTKHVSTVFPMLIFSKWSFKHETGRQLTKILQGWYSRKIPQTSIHLKSSSICAHDAGNNWEWSKTPHPDLYREVLPDSGRITSK